MTARPPQRPLSLGVLVLLLVFGRPTATEAGEPILESIGLPPLRVGGRPARAHTQGLEVVGTHLYVTARREDQNPKQALLLRTELGRVDWDVWNITPAPTGSPPSSLDHAGGLQSDGTRLWIPVAESRKYGRTVIRAILLADLRPGAPPRVEQEWSVDDHIGALAVSSQFQILLGASWDTERVYQWDLTGHLQKTLAGDDLRARWLGSASRAGVPPGLAVQDWKWVDQQLYASGLLGQSAPRSRLWSYRNFLEPSFEREAVPLPEVPSIELAREAMAVTPGRLWFIPGDLGETNRLFRLPRARQP